MDKASVARQGNVLRVVRSYGTKGVSLVLAGSVTQFTEGVISYLSIVSLLGGLRPPMNIRFRTSGVCALSGGNQVVLAVLTSITRRRSRSGSIVVG